jgi:hypothetical protein
LLSTGFRTYRAKGRHHAELVVWTQKRCKCGRLISNRSNYCEKCGPIETKKKEKENFHKKYYTDPLYRDAVLIRGRIANENKHSLKTCLICGGSLPKHAQKYCEKDAREQHLKQIAAFNKTPKGRKIIYKAIKKHYHKKHPEAPFRDMTNHASPKERYHIKHPEAQYNRFGRRVSLHPIFFREHVA